MGTEAKVVVPDRPTAIDDDAIDAWVADRRRRIMSTPSHDLRHHCATLLISAGCSVTAVQHLLRDARTTRASGAGTRPLARLSAAIGFCPLAAITRVAFGLVNFRHHRVRCLLYAGKPDWNHYPRSNPETRRARLWPQ